MSEGQIKSIGKNGCGVNSKKFLSGLERNFR
jgi:hypothetical protein